MSLLSAWSPVAVWAGLIFVISGIPALNSGLGIWDLFLRKMAHMVEFGILAALLVRAFTLTWGQMKLRKIIVWAIFWAVLYACSDEFHQGFVPGREASFRDVLIDTGGILMALALVGLKRQRFSQGEKFSR